MNKNSLALFLLIPAALLIIAPLLSFPYGFYTLLRLIVSVTAGFIIYHSYKGAGGVNEISIIFALILYMFVAVITSSSAAGIKMSHSL